MIGIFVRADNTLSELGRTPFDDTKGPRKSTSLAPSRAFFGADFKSCRCRRAKNASIAFFLQSWAAVKVKATVASSMEMFFFFEAYS